LIIRYTVPEIILTETLTYGYNNDFLPTHMTYAGGTANYAYDDDGLLTRAGAFTITRDPQSGLPTSVADSSLILNRTFNGYGEQTTETYNIAGINVANWSLEYTDAGQIKTKTETIGGVAAKYDYTYDLAGRLTGVTKDGAIVERYQYGPNGARVTESNALRGITERSFVYSIEDHLETAGDTTYQYDKDGFTRERNRRGERTTYQYSSRGELIKVTLPDGRIIEHIHDPLGRRIATKVNGVINEKYLWEGQTRLLAILDGSGSIIMRFNYADGRMPYSMIWGGHTYYLTYDHVGSLRLITNSSGAAVKRVDYDSFGNIIGYTNPKLNVMFGFAGGLHDPDTGLVRFGYRDYNPDTGRWTAKDPILFAGGDTDLYGYISNDPVNWVDPRGLKWLRGPGDEPAMGSVYAGRRIFRPNSPLLTFFERYVPNIYETSRIHDGMLELLNIEDPFSNPIIIFVNIATMPIAFKAAIFTNTWQTITNIAEPIFKEQLNIHLSDNCP
jgi:RHS repeat-associated protein